MELVRAKDRAAWRSWLEENHARRDEAWLALAKKGSPRGFVSYDDAVEESLCFGWVDSAIRRIDDQSYAQRFTPRRQGSKWSPSNLSRMEKLISQGKVEESGLAAYGRRGS